MQPSIYGIQLLTYATTGVSQLPEKFLMSLDEGTTSARAMVWDTSGNLKGAGRQEFPQYYPRPGWVEHNAEEIWDA